MSAPKKPHPLRDFLTTYQMTIPEAAEFFDVGPSALSRYVNCSYKTPAWMLDFLAEPLMAEEEIQRRVDAARKRAAEKYGSSKRTARGTGSPVYRWRKRMGMTQIQAAAYLGVHWSKISAWELGDRDIPEEILEQIEGGNYHFRTED